MTAPYAASETASQTIVGAATQSALAVAADTPSSKPLPWVLLKHPEYAAWCERIKYATDMYTGDMLAPSKIFNYLIQRSVGEADEAYRERQKLADYTPHFAAVVDSLTGMLFAVEGDANRKFNDDAGKGLGDPTDAKTPIGQLWKSADVEGNGWLAVWKNLAIELTYAHRAWVMVDSYDGSPVLRILPFELVPNWRYEGKRLVEALVIECVDTRTALSQPAAEVYQYLHLTTEGWQRYRVDQKTQELITLTNGPAGDFGTYKYVDRDGLPALPIFPCRLPMRRHVGYLMARKANAIFNQESARDHLIRIANFPKLNLVADDALYQALTMALMRGSSTLQNQPGASAQHGFIAPPEGPATVATEVLKRKVEEYYITAFREYGDAAQQRTATEVRQDVSSGAGAFLQLLKTGLDDAENQALWRIEQVLHPDDPSYQFIATVERSDEFLPGDPDVVIARLIERVFGKGGSPLPLGRTARVEAAKQIAGWQGLPVDDEEVEADVDARALIEMMATLGDLPIPAEARADIAMLILSANGLADPEQEVEIDDNGENGGIKKKAQRNTVLRAEALKLAMAEDDAKQNASQALGSVGGAQQTNEPPAKIRSAEGGATGSGGAYRGGEPSSASGL